MRSQCALMSLIGLLGCTFLMLSFMFCSGSRSAPPGPVITVSGPGPSVDVTTWHNDLQRTGQNLSETALTPENVNSQTFGKVNFFTMDGKVDAMPLHVSDLAVNAKARNVVFAASEHDSVYAFDADTGSQLWKVSTLGSGETPSDDHGCGQISPEIGITSTPVIDRHAGANGTLYVVAMSKDSGGKYHQRLHALDLTTGAELFGGPREVAASFSASAGSVTFDPGQYAERAALLLLNGVVYTAWTSHCDKEPYQGWIIGYSASRLSQSSVLNLTPNGTEGAIWMSGAGMAADPAGRLYLLDANGTFDTALDSTGFPTSRDFGNAFLEVSTSPALAVSDYFATFDTAQQSAGDSDLGSGGALVLPDQTDASGQVRQLVVGAGKDGNIYLLDRHNMGKFNSGANQIYQQLSNALGGSMFGAPAYFNGTLYFGAVGQALKALPLQSARIGNPPSSQTSLHFSYPGTTPSISANGTANGIVWAVENGSTAALHAYVATDLSRELYNSTQAGSRDSFGTGNKFITPMIAGGKVFVGTTNGVAVFGLLK